MSGRRVVAVGFALCAWLLAGSVGVDAARWIMLGERQVSDKADHDTIAVGRRDGDFSAIRIEVRRAAVDFHRVVVHFGSGQRHEVEVRATIPSGGSTRVIDLPGRDRTIDRVEFWYDAKTRGGRTATVVLRGRR